MTTRRTLETKLKHIEKAKPFRSVRRQSRNEKIIVACYDKLDLSKEFIGVSTSDRRSSQVA